MSSGVPWGYGINRTEIAELVREVCIAVTGLPENRVLNAEASARMPAPPRPSCMILLGSPVSRAFAHNDERVWSSLESWTVTVTDATDGDYTITVMGTDYTHTASGETIEQVRDGLLTAIGAPTGWTATASGTDAITIDSTVTGQALFVITSPASLTRERTQSAAFVRTLLPLELQVNIECQGVLDIATPDQTQTGEHIADQVRAGFMNRHMTAKMRDCGHVPRRSSTVQLPRDLQRQLQSGSTVQVVIGTTGRLDTQLDTVSEIPLNPTVTQ